MPVVVVGRPVPSADVDDVRTDDDDGLDQAVSYLAQLGHRRITYLDGGRGDVPTLRRRAYRSAMRRHRSRITSASSVVATRRAQADRRHRPPADLQPAATAVVTFNDRAAVGLIDALIRAGVDVPGTISVVGYDDSTVARLAHINLTTVSQNTHQLTEHAISALIDRLDDDRSEKHEFVVPPQLIIRGTTAPPSN